MRGGRARDDRLGREGKRLVRVPARVMGSSVASGAKVRGSGESGLREEKRPGPGGLGLPVGSLRLGGTRGPELPFGTLTNPVSLHVRTVRNCSGPAVVRVSRIGINVMPLPPVGKVCRLSAPRCQQTGTGSSRPRSGRRTESPGSGEKDPRSPGWGPCACGCFLPRCPEGRPSLSVP